MNARRFSSRIVAVVTGSAVVLALGVGGVALASARSEAPSPVPTSTVEPVTFVGGQIGDVLERPAPTVVEPVTPVVEIPLDESAAPVEEAPPAPVEEAPPAPPAPVEPPPAPAPPVLCPAGSSANSSDGYNDTSCMWEYCFLHSDEPRPECDSAFRP